MFAAVMMMTEEEEEDKQVESEVVTTPQLGSGFSALQRRKMRHRGEGSRRPASERAAVLFPPHGAS